MVWYLRPSSNDAETPTVDSHHATFPLNRGDWLTNVSLLFNHVTPAPPETITPNLASSSSSPPLSPQQTKGKHAETVRQAGERRTETSSTEEGRRTGRMEARGESIRDAARHFDSSHTDILLANHILTSRHAHSFLRTIHRGTRNGRQSARQRPDNAIRLARRQRRAS